MNRERKKRERNTKQDDLDMNSIYEKPSKQKYIFKIMQITNWYTKTSPRWEMRLAKTE